MGIGGAIVRWQPSRLLLWLIMRVAVWEVVVGLDALIAQAELLKLERPGCDTDSRSAAPSKLDPTSGQILFEVPKRERHGAGAAMRL
jgi:hypothetical protein